MADWAKERADKLMEAVNCWRHNVQGGYPVGMSGREMMAQALREAERRGKAEERASCLAEVHHQWQVYTNKKQGVAEPNVSRYEFAEDVCAAITARISALSGEEQKP